MAPRRSHRQRARRSGVLVAVLVAGLATAVSPAHARTVTYKRVHSPTKQISCFAVKFGREGIECHAPYLPRVGDLDPFLALHPHGRSAVGERGDYPGYNVRDRKLNYGDVWKRPGIRCTMKTSGITCRNRDKHGFHIQRGNVQRF